MKKFFTARRLCDPKAGRTSGATQSGCAFVIRRFFKTMSGENNNGFTVRSFIFPALDKRRGWTPTPSAFLQNGGPSTRTETVDPLFWSGCGNSELSQPGVGVRS
jgi:hypothetical protein